MTDKIDNSYMMSLGGFRVQASRSPLQSRSKSKAYNFASRARWQGGDALQFKSRSATEERLDIKVIIQSKEDREVLPALYGLGEEGKPLERIEPSEGGYLGKWVITNFSSEETVFTKTGIGLVQTASITIKEYIE